MGAQSDYIAAQFVPSDSYKAQQRAMVQRLIASGVNSDELKGMFSVPFELLTEEKPEDQR
jgi:hypothetical protein